MNTKTIDLSPVDKIVRIEKSSQRLKRAAMRGYEISLVLIGASLTLPFFVWWAGLITLAASLIIRYAASRALRASLKKSAEAREALTQELARRLAERFSETITTTP